MSNDDDKSDDIIGIPSTNESILNLLICSLNREKNLKRLLDEQRLKNDQMQLQLDIKKCKKILQPMENSSSDESEKVQKILKCEIPRCVEDLKGTFGTNSTVLMLYK